MTTYVPENMIDVHLCLGRSEDLSHVADGVPVRLGPGVQLPPTVRIVVTSGSYQRGRDGTGSLSSDTRHLR